MRKLQGPQMRPRPARNTGGPRRPARGEDGVVMPARTKAHALAPEPWWAKFVLALLKLLLAFALAVLTLLLTRTRDELNVTDPPAAQRRVS